MFSKLRKFLAYLRNSYLFRVTGPNVFILVKVCWGRGISVDLMVAI